MVDVGSEQETAECAAQPSQKPGQAYEQVQGPLQGQQRLAGEVRT